MGNHVHFIAASMREKSLDPVLRNGLSFLVSQSGLERLQTNPMNHKNNERQERWSRNSVPAVLSCKCS